MASNSFDFLPFLQPGALPTTLGALPLALPLLLFL